MATNDENSMKYFRITLTERKEICENTLSFTFDTKNTDYNFEAGQYAHFTIPSPVINDIKGNSRPLSFASSPHHKDFIIIAARKDSSVFIDNLSQIPVGSEIHISKPFGNLLLNKNNSDTPVFIAGGIGITPIRSIIEKFIYDKYKSELFSFHSNRTQSQSVFIDDFEKWAAENKNFKFIPSIADLKNKEWKYEFGTIDKKMLEKYLKNFENKIFYVVGPPLMVDTLKEILTGEGIVKEKIKTEKSE